MGYRGVLRGSQDGLEGCKNAGDERVIWEGIDRTRASAEPSLAGAVPHQPQDGQPIPQGRCPDAAYSGKGNTFWVVREVQGPLPVG